MANTRNQLRLASPIVTQTLTTSWGLFGVLVVALLAIGYRLHPRENMPLPSFAALEGQAEIFKELHQLYPPDFFPNGQYLTLPFGRMRYYLLNSSCTHTNDDDAEAAVVFVHGIGTASPVFNRLARRLSRNLRSQLVLYDLYGRGYSDSPGTLHDDSLYVAQLSMLVSHLGLQRFHLVGYSLGGAIATSFASYFAAQLLSLTLIAPAGLMDEIPLVGQVFSAPLVGEVLLSSGLAQFLMKRNARGNFLVLPRPGAYQQRPLVWKEDAVVEDGDSQQIEADIAHLLELTNFQVDHHPGFRRSFLSTTRNFPLTRADRILDRFRVVGQRSDVPVLVIWGTRDGLIPISLWQYLYELIPHAKLKPINNGGHSIVAENSTAVASAMLQHFSELFPSAYCVG